MRICPFFVVAGVVLHTNIVVSSLLSRFSFWLNTKAMGFPQPTKCPHTPGCWPRSVTCWRPWQRPGQAQVHQSVCWAAGWSSSLPDRGESAGSLCLCPQQPGVGVWIGLLSPSLGARIYETIRACKWGVKGRGWLLEGADLWREDRCPQHCDQVLPPKWSLKSHLRHSELIKEQQEGHHGKERPPCLPRKLQNCTTWMPMMCS